MKTLILLLFAVTAYGQPVFELEDSAWSDTIIFKESGDDGTLTFFADSIPLWVNGDEGSLRLSPIGVITIKGDTMHVIKQMIMGLMQDYTIEFCDPPISATKGMKVEDKSLSDTTGLYAGKGWTTVSFGQSPTRELHIVADTIPRINFTLGPSITETPGWIKGWERQETKWTEHVEVLSDPTKELQSSPLCNHDWVFESQNEYGGITTCLVLHGPCGCEREWPDRKQICKQCGLHLRVYKTCETVKDTRETYEDIVKRFK
jgi:hypothetical protein